MLGSPGELSRRAFARTLRAELESMRIRVASIITGPLVSSTDGIDIGDTVKQEDRRLSILPSNQSIEGLTFLTP